MPLQSLPLDNSPIGSPPSAPLRILHAVLSLDCGGLERVVVDLARRSRMQNHQVAVLCLEQPGALSGYVQQMGVPVICLHKAPGLQREVSARAREILTDFQPDVVHTHQAGALLYVGAAARKAGIRAVLHTEHGNHVARAPNWRRRLRYRLLISFASRYCQRFCCVTDDIARSVSAFGWPSRRKVCVVPNGIDCTAFAAKTPTAELRSRFGIPEYAPIIGTVGRLNEIKRQDILIRAFALIARRFTDAHLVLVGDGPVREDLMALTASLDLGGKVHFAGYQAEPQRFLAMMDVFALTSRMEGMPLAILEAWAAGRPVVASAVGGVRDLVVSDENGLLFPSGDVTALAMALERLMSDPIAAVAFGRAGQACVRERFSLECMMAAYESHYRDLLHATSVS